MPRELTTDLRDQYRAGTREFAGVNLREQDFSEEDLSEINLSSSELTGAIFNECWLEKANFYWSKLVSAKFNDATLIDSELGGTILELAEFSRADLTRVKLSQAVATGAVFNDAVLTDADLTLASLAQADLRNADFSGTTLAGTLLRGARVFGVNWPSPEVVLQAQWGPMSDRLALDLMRYDAAQHSDPNCFDAWVAGGKCPYRSYVVDRTDYVRRQKALWSPGRAPSARDLMNSLLEECCDLAQR